MNDLRLIFKDTRKHLMTGVSYMIPFVVAGGILLALSVVLYGEGAVPLEGTWLNDLFFIGVAGFELMIPVLAGYIAFSISDRAGIAPAAVAAHVGNKMGAGFFGAILAGIIGGVVVHYLKKIKVPDTLRSIMPIFVIPIIGTFITAGFMQWGLATPIAALTDALTSWLQGMSTSNFILLAIIIGLMEAFDMGGPVNKVAYAFVILSVGEGIYTIPDVSAVGVAVPSIGMGLATFLAPKKYTPEEKEAGRAALLMGTVGITEGAIPFAAADPIKVIPSIMVGGATGTAVAALFNVQCMVAWGGLIVIPAIIGKLGFIIALAAGSVVTALMVNALKKPVAERVVKDMKTSSDEFEVSID
ncbi:MAG TPA: PTS fructose transporter subunit EIIC [Eubacteriaceae bacterium]|nr:PTS fructose transporter subunit EIIC [Eubacteriaceae bacterium]